MRLHQVLTGAANVLENSVTVAYGNASGFPFTVSSNHHISLYALCLQEVKQANLWNFRWIPPN